MRPNTVEVFGDVDEQGSSMAMDVDEVDPLEFIGDQSVLSAETTKLADADFFNKFEDDFDDTDIN